MEKDGDYSKGPEQEGSPRPPQGKEIVLENEMCSLA